MKATSASNWTYPVELEYAEDFSVSTPSWLSTG